MWGGGGGGGYNLLNSHPTNEREIICVYLYIIDVVSFVSLASLKFANNDDTLVI